ncbi:MAG: IS3 family transposase, partial [Cytophagaceae bacterium]
MKPAAKREAIVHLQEEHGYSQRRACRLTKCNRKSARHTSARQDDAQLRGRLRELAYQRKRWGYRLLNGALRLEGWAINHKRTYRLYKEEKLDLRPKHRRRLKSFSREPRHAAAAANDIWTMDFTGDKLCDGRSFRTLNVLDVFTRRCLMIEVDTSLSGGRVVRVLDTLLA